MYRQVGERILQLVSGVFHVAIAICGKAEDIGPVSYTHLATADRGQRESTKANLMSAVYTAQAAVNTTRTVVQAVAK